MAIYPEHTNLLCYVGDSVYRVLAYDRSLDQLAWYVECLEADPDSWPGYSPRRKGESDARSHGLYTLQVMKLADGWHMSGWQRVTIMEAAQAATGTWKPETTPAKEMRIPLDLDATLPPRLT